MYAQRGTKKVGVREASPAGLPQRKRRAGNEAGRAWVMAELAGIHRALAGTL